MKDITLALFCLGLLALGTAAPFVMGLGYLWVSLVKPQTLAYGFFQSVPIAMVFAVASLLSYLLVDRRSPPKLTALHMLLVFFAVWITLTTFNAIHQGPAWWKWDWAFKEIAFACFLPFVIRSRIHIEAMLYVLTVGTVPLVAAAGLKALVGGGGYGEISVGGTAESLLGENSTRAMYSVMMIAIVLYLRRHTVIMPRNWISNAAVFAYVMLCLLAAVGGYSRTGLVAVVVLGGMLWWFSHYKISLAALMVVIVAVGFAAMSDEWFARMDTIMNPEEDSSALSRLDVWAWTWEFVKSHPNGGGFVSYLSNFGAIPGEERARAFHSIYFEVLGEHGYVGLAVFLGILLSVLKMSYGIYRRNKNRPDLLWLSDLSKAVLICGIVYVTGGTFIGIAFQPYIYILAVITIALRSYELRYHEEALGDLNLRKPRFQSGISQTRRHRPAE